MTTFNPCPKPVKAPKKPRKPMPRKSKKRIAQHASPEGKNGLSHMGAVRSLPCIGCGTTRNVKAHHCKDKPPKDMEWIYEVIPYGCKSGPTDTIPLCDPGCHKDSGYGYHDNRPEFHRRHGFDYLHILPTRAAVAAMLGEIDY